MLLGTACNLIFLDVKFLLSCLVLQALFVKARRPTTLAPAALLDVPDYANTNWIEYFSFYTRNVELDVLHVLGLPQGVKLEIRLLIGRTIAF